MINPASIFVNCSTLTPQKSSTLLGLPISSAMTQKETCYVDAIKNLKDNLDQNNKALAVLQADVTDNSFNLARCSFTDQPCRNKYQTNLNVINADIVTVNSYIKYANDKIASLQLELDTLRNTPEYKLAVL